MKKEISSANPGKLNISLTLNLGDDEILSPNAMNSIRGGDGEDDGRGNVIMIPR